MHEKTKELISNIRWWWLTHAYGFATDAPKAFEELLGNDQDACDDAFLGWFCGSATHQYDVYRVTPSVIKVVICILTNDEIDMLTVIDSPLRRELMSWLEDIAKYRGSVRKVKKALFEGRECYSIYLHDSDTETVASAEFLMSYCESAHQQR